MSTAFICPTCKNEWSMEADKDGLFDGYGNPPCPICGDNGRDPSDYGDFICPYCGHKWRNYGNGGLVLGMWPNCPKCGTQASPA
jgi:DNA-directed RNA polymerase subunit RPC12/RpoP